MAMKFETDINGVTHQFEIDPENGTLTPGDNPASGFDIHELGNGAKLLRLDCRAYRLDNITVGEQQISFNLNGMPVRAPVRDEQALLLRRMGFKSVTGAAEGDLKAPMPGRILEVKVAENQSVSQGTPLVILEAMKMENELKSPVDGTVRAVHIEAGQNVEKNAVLIEIE